MLLMDSGSAANHPQTTVVSNSVNPAGVAAPLRPLPTGPGGLHQLLAPQAIHFPQPFLQAQPQAPPQAPRYQPPPPTQSGGHRAQASSSTPSSMNRSQRCGVCRGCQCKPCGQCTYCQDSPQFGGPGVKKQSCIERRCLRVLENRLQRDAPTFKARQGCNNCEDCRMADCMTCLVCLDKKFFDNRYMTGAMCAKKRCNHATSIELPAAQQATAGDFNSGRQMLKRSYDSNGNGTATNYDYMTKRRAGEGVVPQGIPQPQVPPHMILPGQTTARMISLPSSGGGMNPIYTAAMPHPAMRMLPPNQGPPNYSLLVPMTSIADLSVANNPVTSQPQQPQQQQGQQGQPQQQQPSSQPQPQQQQQQNQNEQPPPQTPLPPQQQPQQQTTVPQPMMMNGNYIVSGYPPMATQLTDMCMMDPRLMQPPPQKLYPYYGSTVTSGDATDLNSCPPQDPFVPPSYAPEMKSTVVLTPL
ncbi:hypothetical protein QR680_014298 [Steinernema hermaphroditum]|uniref:CXXC-type domain-containing protein n=1 Tax=Steinernema hermaphroditum TaxID=289476 RepID=A0AA39I8G1_9BILA|nr:hypothetical protein QR680_014298 [Steinernema hermaphroditum]